RYLMNTATLLELGANVLARAIVRSQKTDVVLLAMVLFVFGSLFYGLFFYRRRITLPAIIGAKVSVNYLINVLLGSLWSSMLYSNGYLYYAGKSVIKNTVMLPVEITLLYLIFKMVLPFLQRRQLVVPQNKPEPEKQD
ncbi:MAG: hypothetical protein IIY72_07410, partial [Solobacterium sp.]|nr:hypothetical protein [Solobacterium sp.]